VRGAGRAVLVVALCAPALACVDGTTPICSGDAAAACGPTLGDATPPDAPPADAPLDAPPVDAPSDAPAKDSATDSGPPTDAADAKAG
jgi:hypothetical protein